MRLEVKTLLSILLTDKQMGGWKDGWVWGRLTQEFTLTPEELDHLATALGYKFGWNPTVESLLSQQWQEEEIRWLAFNSRNAERAAAAEELKFREVHKSARQHQIKVMYQGLAAQGQPITDVEQQIINAVLLMPTNDQIWLLKQIFLRQKSKL